MNAAYESLRNRLESLTSTVRHAEQMILEGCVINLTSLEAEVAYVCDHIKKVPAQTAREIQPHMAELIAALDGLAEHLHDFKTKYK